VEIHVNTGGGASFGYKEKIFLVSGASSIAVSCISVDCVSHETACTCNAACDSTCTCNNIVVVDTPAVLVGDVCPTVGSQRVISGASCIAASCQAYYDAGERTNGAFQLNAAAPFNADCQFDTATGRGWMALSFEAKDNSYAGQKWIVAGGHSDSNDWWKCKDDMNGLYSFIKDGDTGGSNPSSDQINAVDVSQFLAMDVFGTHGSHTKESTTLEYFQPSTETVYTAAQTTYIRSVTSHLSDTTPLTCMDADADNNNAQDGTGHGHEASITAADGSNMFCTPCYSGDCGVECTSSTNCANQNGLGGATYKWFTSKIMEKTGANGCTGYTGALDAKYIMPASVEIYVNTGGGASFGYKEKIFLVSGGGANATSEAFLVDTQLSQNSATHGGSLSVSAGYANLVNVSIRANEAEERGGGIYASGVSCIGLENSLFAMNNASRGDLWYEHTMHT
jgi:predicted outer membrane repeat protein